jgi:hypothetical protein
MVTLYVAAPGAVADEEGLDPQLARDPDVPSPLAARALVPGAGQHGKPRQRRRRKPGLTERPPRVFDTPPPPVQADTDLALPPLPVFTDPDPTEELVSHDEVPCPGTPARTDTPEGVLDDHDGYDDPSDEELVALADDLFAGRACVSWRRVYPSPRRLANSGSQHQRRCSR